MTAKEIFIYLKLSIIQFLIKKNFSFFNKEREVFVNFLSNDKKVSVEMSFCINNDNSLCIYTYFPIKKSFICEEKLMIISNIINQFSSVFNSYIRNFDKDFSLFYIKTSLIPQSVIIDDNYWDFQIKTNINNISTIIDFIYFHFSQSKFFNTEDLNNNKEFKDYLYKCLSSYINALKTIEKQNFENNYKNWSKEEINLEIDRELEKYKKDKSNVWKLNLLVAQLKELENKK